MLGALGGDKPGCVTLTETWGRHAADLGVLAAGPRSAADRVSVDRNEVAEQRANLPAGWAQAISVPMVTAPAGPPEGGGPPCPLPGPGSTRRAAARWSGSSYSNSSRSGRDSSSG